MTMVMSRGSNMAQPPADTKTTVEMLLTAAGAFLVGLFPFINVRLRRRAKDAADAQTLKQAEAADARALQQATWSFAEGRVLHIEDEVSHLRKELQTERESRLLASQTIQHLTDQLAFANKQIADLLLDLDRAKADRESIKAESDAKIKELERRVDDLTAQLGVEDRRTVKGTK